MVSISSKRLIKKRASEFWQKNEIWLSGEEIDTDIMKIQKYLEYEYKIIPEKERVGKGSVYITKTVAEGVFPLIPDRNSEQTLSNIKLLFSTGEKLENIDLFNFACSLLGEFATTNSDNAQKALLIAKKWANNDDWRVREMTGQVIRKAVKDYKKLTLAIVEEWINSENENIRRVVIESLRPLRDIKWLRDPDKNDIILKLLGKLRADSSQYVRKSVGNNLKDLSKYMPGKILSVVKSWMDDADVEVKDDLASYSKSDFKANEDYYLVWTIKHALRWVKKKNPELHPDIEKILGKNYVLYFDEKRNKLARPT